MIEINPTDISRLINKLIANKLIQNLFINFSYSNPISQLCQPRCLTLISIIVLSVIAFVYLLAIVFCSELVLTALLAIVFNFLPYVKLYFLSVLIVLQLQYYILNFFVYIKLSHRIYQQLLSFVELFSQLQTIQTFIFIWSQLDLSLYYTTSLLSYKTKF